VGLDELAGGQTAEADWSRVHSSQGWLELRLKRALDFLIAIALLILLSPVMLGIAMTITFSTKGPVLYRQQRLKQGRRSFTLYKFRTMIRGADAMVDDVFHLNHASGPLFKVANDPRVTAVGRILRRTYLDELPQLLNVLKGEMSLVGPRPCLPQEAKMAGPRIDFRFAVPQGLTGPWQTNGHHNLSFEEQLSVEAAYINGWSLWRDISILAKTVPLVLGRTGM
jgi:lipopolysaccharide/colanic/teichoic acid biosynthesis glycosyltransferase